MTDSEPTDDELALQARECPIVIAALSTGDDAIIARTLGMHPPARCAHVKQAQEADP